MKKVKYLLLTFILTFLSLLNVNAQNIDINKSGSITGVYKYEDKIFSNTKLKLYKIASINQELKYTNLDNYIDFNNNINNLNNSEWTDYAISIDKYITSKNINEDYLKTTDNYGRYKFDNLSTGLYLLRIDNVEIDNYIYISSPILISLPSHDGVRDIFDYDLVINNKIQVERKNDIINPDTNDNSKVINNGEPNKKDNLDNNPKNINNDESNKKDNPHTGDDITKYIVLFIASFIIVLLLIVYLIKRVRKENKNEKK